MMNWLIAFLWEAPVLGACAFLGAWWSSKNQTRALLALKGPKLVDEWAKTPEGRTWLTAAGVRAIAVLLAQPGYAQEEVTMRTMARIMEAKIQHDYFEALDGNSEVPLDLFLGYFELKREELKSGN